MIMNVFIFPGQGSQSNQMLKALRAYSCREAEEVFKIVSEIVKRDIIQLIETSSDAELRKTENTQIVMFAIDMAYEKMLESNGIFPNMVAGHSLGQYPAMVTAGIMSIEQASWLVKERAKLMSSVNSNGGLCAVKSPQLDIEEIEVLCKKISRQTGDVLSVALYNSDKQIVVGGTDETLKLFQEEAIILKRYSTAM